MTIATLEDKSDFDDFFIAMRDEAIWKYDVPEIEFARMDWSMKGLAAGQAISKNGYYRIRMNPQLFEQGATIDDIQNVILHELAHLICFANPAYGKSHNKGWKAVCLGIGGDGERTHGFTLKPSRKVYITRHIYIVGGHSVKVTSVMHKKIQRGALYGVRGHNIYPSHYSETIKIERKYE